MPFNFSNSSNNNVSHNSNKHILSHRTTTTTLMQNTQQAQNTPPTHHSRIHRLLLEMNSKRSTLKIWHKGSVQNLSVIPFRRLYLPKGSSVDHKEHSLTYFETLNRGQNSSPVERHSAECPNGSKSPNFNECLHFDLQVSQKLPNWISYVDLLFRLFNFDSSSLLMLIYMFSFVDYYCYFVAIKKFLFAFLSIGSLMLTFFCFFFFLLVLHHCCCDARNECIESLVSHYHVKSMGWFLFLLLGNNRLRVHTIQYAIQCEVYHVSSQLWKATHSTGEAEGRGGFTHLLISSGVNLNAAWKCKRHESFHHYLRRPPSLSRPSLSLKVHKCSWCRGRDWELWVKCHTRHCPSLANLLIHPCNRRETSGVMRVKRRTCIKKWRIIYFECQVHKERQYLSLFHSSLTKESHRQTEILCSMFCYMFLSSFGSSCHWGSTNSIDSIRWKWTDEFMMWWHALLHLCWRGCR